MYFRRVTNFALATSAPKHWTGPRVPAAIGLLLCAPALRCASTQSKARPGRGKKSRKKLSKASMEEHVDADHVPSTTETGVASSTTGSGVSEDAASVFAIDLITKPSMKAGAVTGSSSRTAPPTSPPPVPVSLGDLLQQWSSLLTEVRAQSDRTPADSKESNDDMVRLAALFTFLDSDGDVSLPAPRGGSALCNAIRNVCAERPALQNFFASVTDTQAGTRSHTSSNGDKHHSAGPTGVVLTDVAEALDIDPSHAARLALSLARAYRLLGGSDFDGTADASSGGLTAHTAVYCDLVFSTASRSASLESEAGLSQLVTELGAAVSLFNSATARPKLRKKSNQSKNSRGSRGTRDATLPDTALTAHLETEKDNSIFAVVDTLMRLAPVPSATRPGETLPAIARRLSQLCAVRSIANSGRANSVAAPLDAMVQSHTTLLQEVTEGCVAGASRAEAVALVRDILDTAAILREASLLLPPGVWIGWERAVHKLPLLQSSTKSGKTSSSSSTVALALVEALLDRCFPQKLDRVRWGIGGNSGAAEETIVFRAVSEAIFKASLDFALHGTPTELAALDTVVDRQETACFARCEQTGAGPATPQLRPRPPLHSPISKMCYVMMCAGYAPATVLSSCLCGPTARLHDVVDAVNAAALFSTGSVSEELPPRVRSLLSLGVADLITRHLRRASQLSADLANDDDVVGLADAATRATQSGASAALPKPLSSYLDEVSFTSAVSRRTAPKTKRSTTKDAASAASGATSKASANYTGQELLSLALHATKEHLVRGDAATAEKLFKACLSLVSSLQLPRHVRREYARETLTYVLRRVQWHLRMAGRYGDRGATIDSAGSLSVTSLAQEHALEAVASLFVPRFCDSFLLSSSHSSDGSSSAAHQMPTAQGDEYAAGAQVSAAALQTVAEAAKLTRHDYSASGASDGDGASILPVVSSASASAVVCGISRNISTPLVMLHAHLSVVLAQTLPSQLSSAHRATLALIQLAMDFVNDVRASQLPNTTRHPQGTFNGTSATVVNQIVTAYLVEACRLFQSQGSQSVKSRSGAPSRRSASASAADTEKESCEFVRGVATTLDSLARDFPVASEPLETTRVRQVLAEVSALVLTSNTHVFSTDTLVQLATAVCAPGSNHRIPLSFFTALFRRILTVQRKPDGIAAEAAESLLVATANMRGGAHETDNDTTQREELYSTLLQALSPQLRLTGLVRLLNLLADAERQPAAQQVRPMLDRLAAAVTAAEGSETATELSEGGGLVPGLIAMVAVLVRYGHGDMRSPHAVVLASLVHAGAIEWLSLDQCGALVDVAGRFLGYQRDAGSSEQEELSTEGVDPRVETAIRAVPRLVAAHVLAVLPKASLDDPAFAHALPPLLRGFSAAEDHQLRAQVSRVLISRVAHVCPQLNTEEAIQCVEAYCRAGVFHERLFGLLLARVSESRQRCTLSQSVRLLRCGAAAGQQPSVRTACLTAARPVFVMHTRRLAEHDPVILATANSVSLVVLDSLRECFPTDRCCATVLEALARVAATVDTPVALAALELVAARGSEDHAALRTLSAHVIEHLLPGAGEADAAALLSVLVRCGMRTPAVFSAVRTALSTVLESNNHDSTTSPVATSAKGAGKAKPRLLRSETLCSLCASFTLAAVQVDTETANFCMECIEASLTAHLDADGVGAPSFSAAQVTEMLLWLSATRGAVGLVHASRLVDDLLHYVESRWAEARAAELSPKQVETLLRTAAECASRPKDHLGLAPMCADVVAAALSQLDEARGSGGGAAVTADGPWTSDLLLVANIASYLSDMGAAQHPAVRQLLVILDENRASITRRHLLLQRTRHALLSCGPSVHPELYEALII